MRKATKNDKELVVNIISESFIDNIGVNWLLRKNIDKHKALRRLATYAFYKALCRHGVYIADNNKGVILGYESKHKHFSFMAIWHEIHFALTSIKFSRIPASIKRESFKKSKRPRYENYLYMWFFAALKDGEKAAFELKDAIFNEAKEKHLSVYLEAASQRNMLIYKRYGFSTYYYWENEEHDIRYWFMKWSHGI